MMKEGFVTIPIGEYDELRMKSQIDGLKYQGYSLCNKDGTYTFRLVNKDESIRFLLSKIDDIENKNKELIEENFRLRIKYDKKYLIKF